MTAYAPRERHPRQREVDDIEDIDIPSQERAQELSAETDALLDEVDELLNELPQDLATNFVQRNGE